jgi:DNA-binding transcriptional MerR regulator
MRISELSGASGISVPTIKYYLRERLLHRGQPTAPNQAMYDESHLRRLHLIRVLTEVGKLGIADVRAVIDAISNERLPLHQVVGVAQYALGPAADDDPVPEDVARARQDVDHFITRRRWRVFPDAPSRNALADALVALRRLGRAVGTEIFVPYANIADDLARWELDFIPTTGSRSATVEAVVVGTVVFEAALVALRRLAHEHHSSQRLRKRSTKQRGA